MRATSRLLRVFSPMGSRRMSLADLGAFVQPDGVGEDDVGDREGGPGG